MKEFDLKHLKFEPVLNFKEDVKDVNFSRYSKAVLNSDLKLMFMKPQSTETLICLNPDERKVIFKTQAYSKGEQTHHWVKIQGRHYLSVQSQKNIFKFFKVSATNGFTEDKALRVTLDDGDDVRFVEYDGNFENMYLVKNENILEQRTVSGGGGVVMNIKLEEKVDFGNAFMQRMSVSKDGNMVAIAGGNVKSFSYIIDVSK